MYPSIIVSFTKQYIVIIEIVLPEQLLLVNTGPVPSAPILLHGWIHLHRHSSGHLKSRGPCEYQTCPLNLLHLHRQEAKMSMRLVLTMIFLTYAL